VKDPGEALPRIARVAVFAPVARAFDYRVPPSLSGAAQVGARVWAPFGGRALEGVIVALDPPDAIADAKPLSRILDAPPIGRDLVALSAWMSEYYCAAPGEVLRLMLPAGGAARGHKRVTLTDAGRAAAAGLDAALLPVALADLDGAARALLRLLAEAEARKRSVRPTDEQMRALKVLVARDLATVGEAVATRGPKRETILRVARPVDRAALGKKKRAIAVYEQIAVAGELALSALQKSDTRAGAHVRVLIDAGFISAEIREMSADPFSSVITESHPLPVLTSAQADVLARLEPALRGGAYAPFLLHGVTGSGKTEVYLRAIASAISDGKTALVLVPEISLTPQLALRFRARFGDRVAVLHSGLSEAARAEAWRRIQRGQVPIALGARSAVFAPLARLGIVVVDEEHDPSFKQEDGVRYNGRDVALVRARHAGAVALLGSATPSLETFHAAQAGRLGYLTLPERATARPLPAVEIVDLKRHKTGEGFLASPLDKALTETLAAGEQAILFLNRRGYSTFLLCKACGRTLKCRDCSVSLTYHRGPDKLLCHYCGFATAPAKTCLLCGMPALEKLGFGTEQVEAALKLRFPTARVARLDRDTAAGEGLQACLDAFRARAIDVLVGTQMVTKGHDFPDVTLVGVILADQGMGLPDFRASERTFQLLEQVAGRAGRGDKPGRVIVQTYNPEHPAVTCARDHDYARFAVAELASRQAVGEPPRDFPPFTRLACVRFDGADVQAVVATAEAGAAAARLIAERAPVEEHAEVHGPAEAPLSRLKGRSRWQLFVHAERATVVRTLARAAAEAGGMRGVRATIDIDPISML
jgi:primosomal protein N' (replication factor Y)